QGFEPQFSGSEPDVLPLDDLGIDRHGCGTRILKISVYAKVVIRLYGFAATVYDMVMEARTLIAAVVAGGLLYIAGQYINARESSATANNLRPGITVQGTGKVDAVPNKARITLGVTTDIVETAEAATAALEEKMAIVLADIRRFEIPEENIKTEQVSVQPVYDFFEGRQEIRGYQATQQLQISLDDASKTGPLISSTTRQGVNQVGSVQFDREDSARLEFEAQQKAIEDARQKAQTLADALGVKLGKVVSFNTASSPTTPPPFFLEQTARSSADQALELPPGSNEISATVTVTYEIR
ncbi:MAG: SIMPL domain-containing protein, partial [Acidobacteriota bacterium]